MTFAGKVWKLLVGVKDALVLLFMLLFFGGLWALMSAHPKVGTGQRGALLLALDGPVVEQPSQPTPSQILGGGRAPHEYRLRDMVQALRAAAKDSRVPAVVLDLDIFAGGGQTALSQVGEALDEVRKAGKPVLAYASAYDDGSYQLAAHASEIWLNPLGGVVVTGPGGTELFYKGLMDKLGITANVYRVGTYKAAVEPFIRNDMSPEAKQALQGVYGAMWENWQQEVKKARPKADVAGYVGDPTGRIAAAGGDLAQAALKAGLVDHLGGWTEFGKRVAQIAGTREEDVPGSFRKIDYGPWAAANPVDDDGRIGILTIAGDIVDGDAGPGTAGAETIVRALDRALRDRDLKALVLRVDSPGGSVLASERIRQAVLAAKAKGLPVVVSMGNLAASGGYWVSTAGDKIYAEPSTITGSIGVFAILPSFQGTLAKLGIGADGVRTTPLSGEPDLLRGPSPEAGKLIQSGIDGTYRHFLALVGAARHMTPQQVDKIAQGHIWDGGTARQLGLVDAFGNLDDAVHEAARRAKLDPATAKAVWLERKPGFGDRLIASLARGGHDDDAQGGGDAFARIGGRPRLLLARAMAEADRLLAGSTIQARCLECPDDGSLARQAPPPSSGFALWLLKLVG
jgi:protease-4